MSALTARRSESTFSADRAARTAALRTRLLTIQFWTGIALAPFAALLLIAGGTTAAAVLAIIAVVVLALAVILRRELGYGSGAAAEAAVFDEIDMLRDDVRADITTAARATHRALTERMAFLEDSLAAMQRQVDAAQSVAIEARGAIESRGAVESRVGAEPRGAVESRAAVESRGGYGHGDTESRDRAESRDDFQPPPRRPVAVASVPAVVRHTETVVTRSTYVDQPADGYGSGGIYGHSASSRLGSPEGAGGYGAAPARRERDADAGERSYRDWDAEDGRVRASGDRRDDVRLDDAGSSSAHDTRPALPASRAESWADQRARPYLPVHVDDSDDLANDPRWSDMRGGQRWAEVRADERSRELRMAERREARRVDGTGTQLHIIDRWSSVREERVDQDREADGRGEDGRIDAGRRDDGRRDDRRRDDQTRAERRRREDAKRSEQIGSLDPDDSGGWRVAAPAGRPAAALPRQRTASDADSGSWGALGERRGWRDVRSGVIEPDHSHEWQTVASAGRDDGQLERRDPWTEERHGRDRGRDGGGRIAHDRDSGRELYGYDSGRDAHHSGRDAYGGDSGRDAYGGESGRDTYGGESAQGAYDGGWNANSRDSGWGADSADSGWNSEERDSYDRDTYDRDGRWNTQDRDTYDRDTYDRDSGRHAPAAVRGWEPYPGDDG